MPDAYQRLLERKRLRLGQPVEPPTQDLEPFERLRSLRRARQTHEARIRALAEPTPQEQAIRPAVEAMTSLQPAAEVWGRIAAAAPEAVGKAIDYATWLGQPPPATARTGPERPVPPEEKVALEVLRTAPAGVLESVAGIRKALGLVPEEEVTPAEDLAQRIIGPRPPPGSFEERARGMEIAAQEVGRTVGGFAAALVSIPAHAIGALGREFVSLIGLGPNVTPEGAPARHIPGEFLAKEAFNFLAGVIPPIGGAARVREIFRDPNLTTKQKSDAFESWLRTEMPALLAASVAIGRQEVKRRQRAAQDRRMARAPRFTEQMVAETMPPREEVPLAGEPAQPRTYWTGEDFGFQAPPIEMPKVVAKEVQPAVPPPPPPQAGEAAPPLVVSKRSVPAALEKRALEFSKSFQSEKSNRYAKEYMDWLLGTRAEEPDASRLGRETSKDIRQELEDLLGPRSAQAEVSPEGMPKREAASVAERREPLKVAEAALPPSAQPEAPQVSVITEPSRRLEMRTRVPSTSQRPSIESTGVITEPRLAPGFDPTTKHERFHPSDDIPALRSEAQKSKPALDEFLTKIPGQVRTTSRVKSEERMLEKSSVEIREPGTLSDVLAGRAIFRTPEQMRDALGWLGEHGEILRVKDWTVDRHQWGFRGINVVVRPEGVGFPTEVNLTLPEYHERGEAEHHVYEKWRGHGPVWSPEDWAEMQADRQASQARWEQAEQRVAARLQAEQIEAQAAAPALIQPPEAAPAKLRTPPPEPTVEPTARPAALGPAPAPAEAPSTALSRAIRERRWDDAENLAAQMLNAEEAIAEVRRLRAEAGVQPPPAAAPERARPSKAIQKILGRPAAEPPAEAEAPAPSGFVIEEPITGVKIRPAPAPEAPAPPPGAETITNPVLRAYALQLLAYERGARGGQRASRPEKPPTTYESGLSEDMLRAVERWARHTAEQEGRQAAPTPMVPIAKPGLAAPTPQALLHTFYRGIKANAYPPGTPVAMERWVKERFEVYDADMVYDALEGAFTKLWRDRMPPPEAPLAERLRVAQEVEDTLGRIRRARDLATVDIQKFSTPYPLAEVMASAAAPRAGEVVLEPTAGTGNLLEAVWGRKSGARLAGNELDPHRSRILRELGYESRTGDYLTMQAEADVIVTNPPWGIVRPGKRRAPQVFPFKLGDISQRFVFRNMKHLKPGGRLVALLPEDTMTAAGAAFRQWLRDNHTVRLMLRFPRGVYATRATDVGAVLVVVDKGKVPGAPDPVVAEAPTATDAIPFVEAAARTRPRRAEAEPAPALPAAPAAIVERGAEELAAPAAAEARPEPAARPTAPAARPERGGAAPAEELEPGRAEPLGGGVPGPRPDIPRVGADVVPVEPLGERPAAQPVRARRLVPQAPDRREWELYTPVRREAYEAAAGSALFVPYQTRGRGRLNPHPRQPVETRALAGVPYPELTHELQPDLHRHNAEGRISNEALDAVTSVAQATEVRGHGMIVADETGFGKSREIAGVILEWMARGAKRILVTTVGRANVEDLVAEFNQVTGGEGTWPYRVVNIMDHPLAKTDALPALDNAVYMLDSHNFNRYQEKGLLAPLQFDGWVADEAHKFKNQENKRGGAWHDLHKDMLARGAHRFAYFTATPGARLEDLGYLHGLRLWSPDAQGFSDWLLTVAGKVKKVGETEFLTRRAEQLRGLLRSTEARWRYPEKHAAWQAELDNLERKLESAVGTESSERGNVQDKSFLVRTDPYRALFSTPEMEQVMRELKITGRYMSRDMWRGGLEFEIKTIKTAEERLAGYNRAVIFAREVEEIAKKFGKENKAGRSFGVRGFLQDELKRRQFDIRLDDIIEDVRAAVAGGEQVVIALINVHPTGEGGGSLGAAVRAINTRKTERTDTGELIDMGEIPEALEKIVELSERLREEAPPLRDPIKAITDAFGEQNVAVLTGDTGPAMRTVLRKEFQENARKVVVISAAAKEGISLHHVTEAALEGTSGKGRRHMMVADFDWSAFQFKQSLGRVDRAGQISAPKISVYSLGSAAELKFLSTVAGRMAGLGAVSKGAARATGTEPLEDFEIGDSLALEAMHEMWKELPAELKRQFLKHQFVDPQGEPKPVTAADMKDFLLDLQLIPTTDADAIMERFLAKREELKRGGLSMEEIEQRAAAEGVSVEDYLADLRQEEVAQRTARGEIVSDMELGPHTSLAVVREGEGPAARRYGVLYGMVTDRMADVLEAVGREHGTLPPRRYITFEGADGSVVSGLVVKPSAISRVAALYGALAKGEALTPEKVLDNLKLGERVELGLRDWTLRMRRDGRIVIEGAKMRDRRELADFGVKYDPARNLWILPEERVAAFAERFQVKQAPPSEALPQEAEVPAVQYFRPTEPRYAPATSREAEAQAPAEHVAKEIKSRQQILSELEHRLNVPIRLGRFRARARGIFKRAPEVIRLRAAADIEAATHEVGHWLEKHLFPDLRRGLPRGHKELLALAEGVKKPSVREGIAEFVRLYVTDDAKALEGAPEFYRYFERRVENEFPEVREALISAREDYVRSAEAEPTARVLASISFGEKAGRSYGLHDFYTDFLDAAHPVRVGVDAMAGERPPRPGEDPYVYLRVLAGWRGKADSFLERAPLRFHTLERAGKPLRDILAPIRRDRKPWTAYAVARRAEELLARKIPLEWDVETARAVVKDNDSVHFRRAFDEYQVFNRQLLSYLRDAGGFSEEQMQAVVRLNQQYVPYFRVVEGEESRPYSLGKRVVNLWSPVRRIKGGERRLVDPIESMVKNTYTLVNWAERNYAAQVFIDFALRHEGLGKYVEEVQRQIRPVTVQVEEVLRRAGLEDMLDQVEKEAVTVFRPALWETEPNVVTVWREGKPSSYKVDPELYKALMASERETGGFVVRMLRPFATTLRAGATLALAFMQRNPVRDQWTAMVNSQYGYVPAFDFVRGLWHALRKDNLYWDFKVAGGAYSALVSMDRAYLGKEGKRVMQSRARRTANVLANPLEFLRAASELMENATRIGEFGRAIRREGPGRAGMTAAAYAAREVTVDFQRMGAKMAAINQIAAFWNAGLQGVDRLSRQFKDHKLAFTVRTLMGVTAPSVLLYLANKDDPRWRDLHQWEKDIYWIILTQDSVYRIPKPWELGILFGSFVERMMDSALEQDPRAWDGALGSLFRALPGPTDAIPTGLKPFLENMVNYSFFLERPVVPKSELELEPAEQYGPYTTEAAKRIGRALGYSPRKIENLVRGLGGTLGAAGLRGVSAPLAPGGEAPSRRVEEVLFPAFVSRYPAGGTKHEDRFYRLWEEARRVQKTLSHYERTGQMDRAQRYAEQNAALLGAEGAFRDVGEHLKALREEQERVLADRAMSGEEKRSKIEQLSLERGRAAREFLQYVEPQPKRREAAGF